MRIAVIDDEKYSRLELIHQIRHHLPQAEIMEAGNGVQAMALLEKNTFDILFVDIHLGDMEGTTVAALARRLMPEAKIIFATAYSEYAVTAFELGVDNYILKPFDPARIRQVLEQCAARPAPVRNEGRLAISSNRHTILLDVDLPAVLIFHPFSSVRSLAHKKCHPASIIYSLFVFESISRQFPGLNCQFFLL